MVTGITESVKSPVDYESMSPLEISRVASSTARIINDTSGTQPYTSWLIAQAFRGLNPTLSAKPISFLKRFTGELLSETSPKKLTPDTLVKIFQAAIEKTKAKALHAQNPSPRKPELSAKATRFLDLVTSKLLSKVDLDKFAPNDLVEVFQEARTKTGTDPMPVKLSPQSIKFLEELWFQATSGKLTPDALVRVFQATHRNITAQEIGHAEHTDWALEDVNQQRATRKTQAEVIAAAPSPVKSRSWWNRFHK